MSTTNFEVKIRSKDGVVVVLVNETPVGRSEKYREFSILSSLTYEELEQASQILSYVSANVDYCLSRVQEAKNNLDTY